MALILVSVIVLLLIYGPGFWVKYVIKKHSNHIDGMPGTGAELARHLIERFELEGVVVEEKGRDQNYYSPAEKVIGLSPDVYNGKSISAVAIATHEVGHAIQYGRSEPISRLRQRYLPTAMIVQRIGVFVLSSLPIVGLASKSPALMLLVGVIGVIAMLSCVLCHALILPEEFDASFNKALPILEEGYVPEAQLGPVRQVLRAAAFTYVAGALTNVLSIWRWLAVLR